MSFWGNYICQLCFLTQTLFVGFFTSLSWLKWKIFLYYAESEYYYKLELNVFLIKADDTWSLTNLWSYRFTTKRNRWDAAKKFFVFFALSFLLPDLKPCRAIFLSQWLIHDRTVWSLSCRPLTSESVSHDCSMIICMLSRRGYRHPAITQSSNTDSVKVQPH